MPCPNYPHICHGIIHSPPPDREDNPPPPMPYSDQDPEDDGSEECRMTLEEAINILVHRHEFLYSLDITKKNQATELGIEALKRIDNVRNIGNVMPGSLLPGEIEK